MTTNEHDEDEGRYGFENVATERGVLEFDSPRGMLRAMYNGVGTWDIYKPNHKCWIWHCGVKAAENISPAALYQKYDALLEKNK